MLNQKRKFSSNYHCAFSSSSLLLFSILCHLALLHHYSNISADASVVEIPRPQALYGSSESGTSPVDEIDDEDDDGMEADASDTYGGTSDQDSDDDESFGGDGYGFDGGDGAETRSEPAWVLPTVIENEQGDSNHSVVVRLRRASPAGTEFNDDRFDEDIDWNIRGRIDLKGKPSFRQDIRHPIEGNSQQMRASASTNNNNNNNNNDNDNDYGEDDSWVHDGVDDVYIDPETKNAASEMSYDEKSIDAEYAPYQQANKTRLTTITEVIPIEVGAGGGHDDNDLDKEDPDSTTQVQSERIKPHSAMSFYHHQQQQKLPQDQRPQQQQTIQSNRQTPNSYQWQQQQQQFQRQQPISVYQQPIGSNNLGQISAGLINGQQEQQLQQQHQLLNLNYGPESLANHYHYPVTLVGQATQRVPANLKAGSAVYNIKTISYDEIN